VPTTTIATPTGVALRYFAYVARPGGDDVSMTSRTMPNDKTDWLWMEMRDDK